ncbi:MAG: hypothetical protein OYK82_05170 [Gammaproteobacteria bacterium]|nr:hypothetical protein [Gammaproteobacteria bacterium]
MRQLVDPGHIRERVRAFAGVAVALSFLLVSVAEASHSHAGAAESTAACSVCQLGHEPGQSTESYSPGVTGPHLLRAPVLDGHRPAPAALHFSPHRSRAPPLSFSL